MREGLFGGTFNPLHNGHLRVITHVKSSFKLDRIHLIPSQVPPHKSTQCLAPATVRLEMIQQSIHDLPGLSASDLELQRPGPSFSIDTIRSFIRYAGPRHCLFFIMGMDAFMEMHTWKSVRDIFKTIAIIVMTRSGRQNPPAVMLNWLNRLIHEEGGYQMQNNAFYHPTLQPVHICRTPDIPISSTTIRERVQTGMPVTGLVPDPVARIIEKKGLYL